VLIVSVNALQSALGLAIVCAVTTHGGRAERARNDLEVAIPAGLPVGDPEGSKQISGGTTRRIGDVLNSLVRRISEALGADPASYRSI
jgi:mRNA-degrading endonuclease toxin of MazEF toxin-antitoxin module